MCHNVDTVAVEARRCQFRQMVRAPCAPMSRGCTGKKVSLFIFFCRLRSLVCRSHDLRHFRFPATQRFPPSQCLSHDDSAHAIFIRRYNGLHCCYTRTASIADFDTRKDAWSDSQTRRWTHLRELNVRRNGFKLWMDLDGAIPRGFYETFCEPDFINTRACLETNHFRIYEASLFFIFSFFFLSAS